MQIEPIASPKFKRNMLLAGLVILLSGLALFAYLGAYNRHWADDWCYNADFRHKGFLETVRGYAYDTTYTPSRYSVTIFAGILQAFDVFGDQLMTPLTILFWTIGLVWLLINIARLAGLQTDPALITFFSALIVYFSVYLTPHLYQSIYWRTGLLTYTSPIVLTLWVFVVITHHALRAKPSRWNMPLAAILALLAGGCSEAGATVLVSSLAIYLGIALIYRKQPWAQKTWIIASVSLFFAIVALCLLVFSPSTLIRKTRYANPTPLLELPRLMFNYTYSFFVLAVKDIHHILIAVIAALAGLAYPILGERSYKFDKFILFDLFVVAVTVLLVAASLTPSLYIEHGLPAPRTMIIPRFIAAFGFALGGLALGSGLREIVKPGWVQTGTAALLLISFAFPIQTMIKASDWIAVYNQRAQVWDTRAAIIQSALNEGAPRVTVTAIDGLPIGGIRDFDPPDKKGYWITLCAADYYGIKLDVVLP